MCRTELTALNQNLVRGRPVQLHCPSSWKSRIQGGDYKELQRFQRKDYIGCPVAHGQYLAPSQKLMSKTIINCVSLPGLIYQEGNKMKQNKLQNKRATSDRAYRKVNKRLATVLMHAINTSHMVQLLAQQNVSATIQRQQQQIVLKPVGNRGQNSSNASNGQTKELLIQIKREIKIVRENLRDLRFCQVFIYCCIFICSFRYPGNR